MANPQHVYHMHKLSKTYPGGKQVLKDISLSFFPGAKIGVVGLNGSGKSTLLQDHGRRGRGLRRRGVGGRGRPRRLLGRRSRSSMPAQGRARQRHGGRGGEEGAGRALQRDRRQLLRRDRRRDGQAAGRDRGARPVGPRHAGGAGAGRAALPAGRRGSDEAVGRREAARCLDQALALQARHPAARRADQPSGCGVGRLARALPQGVRRLHHAGDPRPLFPGQHHRVDAGARSRAGRALQGQLFELAGAEGKAPRDGEGAGGGQAAHAASASSNGSGPRPRRGRPSPRRASRPTSSWPRRPAGSRPARRRSRSRRVRGWAAWWWRWRGCRRRSATGC